MGRLSIAAAWTESSDFLKRHFGALLTVAVALIAFPNVATQALAPVPVTSGGTVQPGLWLLHVPLVLLLGLAGSIALSTLALGREAVVGDALRHGFRRLLPTAGATLLLVVAALTLFVPLVLATGIGPRDLIAPTPATAARIGLVMLVGLFFAVRLVLLTPVAAAEPVGPVAIIRRSWALTRGHFWKLLGFLVLLTLAGSAAMAVVLMVLGRLVGLVAGPSGEGGIAQLIMLLAAGLLNAAFIVVMTSAVARIYVQLAGAPASGT